MGQDNNRQAAKQEIRARNQRQIDSIYQMMDESITINKNSRKKLQNAYDQSLYAALSNNSISNLNQVLEQLLQSFQLQEKYTWGNGIYRQFKKHFRECFEEVWTLNKEDFYKIILANCKFDTLDFQEELNDIAHNKVVPLGRRNSFKDFFYQVGAARLQNRLPSSIISEDSVWEEDFLKQNQTTADQFNLNAINATIINNQFDPEQYMQSHYEHHDTPNDTDFLPLFVQGSGNKNMISSPSPIKQKRSKQQSKLRITEANIQNSSLIMPETIFLNRLSQQVKQQVGDLVIFYRQFGNALQRMFFSVSLLSAPFKHFIYLLTANMERKNISNRKKKKNTFPTDCASLTAYQKCLYGQNQQAYHFRQRRAYNNDIILDEIRDFTEAYTEFIWKYLELNEITELKLGRLISIQALYGIVLKSVWKYVQFISERGYQYEQWKLEQFYQYNDISSNPKLQLSEDKKKYLLRILKKLKGQRNPQKYLKKIVILYREVSSCASCADELLYIYEQLLVTLIKAKETRELGLFRMRNVIQKLLRIDEAYSGGGQIGYSWTSWCIITQLLKERVSKKTVHIQRKRKSKIETEPDAQLYFQQEQNANL